VPVVARWLQPGRGKSCSYPARRDERRGPALSAMRPGTNGFRILRDAVAALCERRREDGKFDSSVVVSAVPYSSYGAASNYKTAAFSLVELVLALGIVAFCLFAVFGLMPVGM